MRLTLRRFEVALVPEPREQGDGGASVTLGQVSALGGRELDAFPSRLQCGDMGLDQLVPPAWPTFLSARRVDETAGTALRWTGRITGINTGRHRRRRMDAGGEACKEPSGRVSP